MPTQSSERRALKIVHYLNQFFAGIGGEDSAYAGFQATRGAVGPGVLLTRLLADAGFEVELTTVYCGDTYAAEHVDEVTNRLEGVVREVSPHVVVLGPAFNSGRYGLVCGEMAARIPTRTGVPAITGLYEENAAVGLFRSKALIVRTANSAMGMAAAMETIAGFIPRLASGEAIDSGAEDVVFGTEHRRNRLESKTAADRAVDILLQVMNNVDIGTELSIPDVESVPVPEPVRDLSMAKVALVTEGGLVPAGNPDRLSTGASERWGAYSLDELLASPGHFQSIHGGYDTHYVNESPFRLLPVDALMEMVDERRIGSLHPQYFVTSGTATKVQNCRMMGSQIAEVLRSAGVQAVILTGT